jgi:hypothetical protein
VRLRFAEKLQVKRLGWVLALLIVATPAWSASKKLTVQQLKDTLVSFQQSKLTDDEISDRLKVIDLSEELAGGSVDSLENYLPGPLTREQIEILQERSAFLPPPATDIPAIPAPDAATQKAILAKASDFGAKVYLQNPHLSVIKALLRYEDEILPTSSAGIHTVDLLQGPVRLVGKRVDPVETNKGVEQAAGARAKTKWGENGQISEGEPGTNLGAMLLEASSSGKIDWLRWQTIDGKLTAVFSFAVDKKKSHFGVSYCCFPKTETEAVGMGPLQVGSIQSLTTWRPFKKVLGYHGEFFIDPNTGAVVRVITRAELSPSDFVSREDRRIDYGPVVVDGTEYLLPRVSYTTMEAVPNGDSYSGACTIRHSMYQASYQNYKLAGAL